MIITSFNILVSMEAQSNSLLNCKLPKARNDCMRTSDVPGVVEKVCCILVESLHWGFEQKLNSSTG